MKKANKPKNLNMSLNAMSEIPTPNANAQPITALQKTSGKITGYQLADGRLLDKPNAVQLARCGGISGVGIATRRGSEYLKSIPDSTGANNLSELPTC